MRRLILILAVAALDASAQTYAVNLTGGITGSGPISGMTSYSGNFREDIRLLNCANPNTGSTSSLISGVPAGLRWSATANRIEASFPQDLSGAGNIAFLDTTGWPTDVELRVQRQAGAGGFIAIEKWDAAGGGYVFQRRILTGTNANTYSTLTLAATSGCQVAFLRVYLDFLPLGSAPPSAISNPNTGALRAWNFDDRASPAADSSGAGANMNFTSTPTWDPEDTSLACWASAVGNSTAGAPITLASYVRGTVAARNWRVTSQPSVGTARLSSYSTAAPLLLNATAGSYSFTLYAKDVGGGETSCSTTQAVTAPTAGTGGYLRYSVGVDFSAYPGTDSVRVSVVQPNGTHVSGSPYRCWTSSCMVSVDDTGMGLHTYRVERLNVAGTVISATDWKPLKTTQLAVTGTPIPTKPALPKMMAVAYGNSGTLATRFIGPRFDIRIAGADPRPYNPNITYSQYRDGSGFYYAGEYWEYRSWMESQGWPYEDGILHAYVNHGNLQDWTKVNRFGEDQWNTASQPTKGVMIWNGSSFLPGPDDPLTKLSNGNPDNVPTPDHSIAAWDATTGDIPIGNNTMYVGYPEPFDLLNAVVGTARVGGSVTWEYCSADDASHICTTWSTLSVTDASSGFSAAAGSTVRTITFTPPSNWKNVVVNASQRTFYLRAVVSGTSTPPVLSQIYGDEWKTYGSLVSVTSISNNNGSPSVTTGTAHGYVAGDVVNIAGLTGGWATAITQWERVVTVTDSTHFTIGGNTSTLGAWPGGSVTVQNRDERGWDPTSGSIVTVAGGYQYNPTPPATATAKFKYQSRVRSFFASVHDQFMFNDNGKDVNGIIYWSRYIAEGTITAVSSGAYNGMMLDNADVIPESVWAYNDLDWADKPYTYSSILIRDKKAVAVGQLRTRLHTVHPTAKIGGNAHYRTASICAAMDFCLLENRIKAGEQYAFGETVNTDGDPIIMFDTASNPAINPNCSVAYVHIWSDDSLDPLDADGVQYWYDKANRRPMLALATFYIGWNGDACMGFAWNSGTFTYSPDDDFYYATGDTYLTTPITGHPTNLQSFDIADTSQLWSGGGGNPFPEMAILIGEPPVADYFGIANWTGNTLNTNGAIHRSWPVGTRVRVRKIGHQGTTPIPWERLLYPAIHFPAMSVSIGTPVDTTPGTGRKLAWKTPAEYGAEATSSNMSMREYTNGIVVIRPLSSRREVDKMNGCSTTPVALGGTYYRLQVDGKTEATPYTTIKLREGEAFIGLKSATSPTEVPAWQQNTCP